MKPRMFTRAMAWGMVVTLLGSLLVMGFAAGGQASSDDCDDLDEEITDSKTIDEDCDVEGDLVIKSGGTLTVSGALLRIGGTDDAHLIVEAGGNLIVQDEGGIAANEDDDTTLFIEFQQGSQGSLEDAVLEGYQTLRIASDNGVGMDNVTIQGAGTGLLVEDDVRLVVKHSSIGADTAVSAGENATVIFESTTAVGSIVLEDTALMEIWWHVQVTVDAEYENVPITVRFQDAHGAVDPAYTVNLNDGETAQALLLEETRGSQEASFGPFRAIAVQGNRANHMGLDLIQGDHELHVPDDMDNDDPEWPSEEALTQIGQWPGYSNDGNIELAWAAADDTKDGEHENRDISHYHVMVDNVKQILTRDTEAVVEDLDEGDYTVKVTAFDLVGKEASTNALDIRVDKTFPEFQFTTEQEPVGDEAFAGPVNVTVVAQDPGDSPSGLSFLRWRLGDGPTSNNETEEGEDGLVLSSETIRIEASGNHSINVVAQDRAGNRAQSSFNVIIDTTPPQFISQIQPQRAPGQWHNAPPNLHVNVVDAGPSGVGEVRWRLGDGDWRPYNLTNETHLIEEVGEHTLRIEVTDGAGNVARSQHRVAYDPYAPELETSLSGPEGNNDWFTGPVDLEVSAKDDISGVQRIEIRTGSGAWRTFEAPHRITAAGTHELTVRATDRAGNDAQASLTVRIDDKPPIPPEVDWSARPDGRVQADWPTSPPLDQESGIASITIERAGSDPDGAPAETWDVELNANGRSISDLRAGDHKLRVVVTDRAGNQAATEWHTVRALGAAATDDEPLRARGIMTLEPSPEIQAQGLTEVQYYIEGSLKEAIASEPFTYTWDTTRLEDGPYEVRIVAFDTAGIHHEEVRVYEVRNSWFGAILDDPLPAVVVMFLSTGGVGLTLYGYNRWVKGVAS